MWRFLTLMWVFLFQTTLVIAQNPLQQISQNFDENPGWEAYSNRVECTECPTVTQDFGWSPTTHTGPRAGEIGGKMWQSTTPAHYGLPFGKPLSLMDPMSASGTIAVMTSETGGVGYLGFFNHQRQEWRPWSSLALRILNDGKGKAWIIVDCMSGEWGAAGFETDISFPANGSVHRWSLDYDPHATLPAQWPKPQMRNWLTGDRRTVEDILPFARKDEPGITPEQLQEALSDALAQGLISNIRRGWGIFWHLNETYEGIKGAITVKVDNQQPYRFFLTEKQILQPTEMDRFGLFNMQTYHRPIEFYVGDLTVNNQKIDLGHDPNWKGLYNRATFVERDFQRTDFGYSETSWAGGGIGEIGGQFYRLEPNDPNAGYFGDSVGGLTLDDPVTFSGKICFVNGTTDAGMFFGYFDPNAVKETISDPKGGSPLRNQMGIVIDGPTRIGYYFSSLVSTMHKNASHSTGPVYLPKAEPATFCCKYDPSSGEAGRITILLGNDQFSHDLKQEQRKDGAVFSHFGLVTVRSGGKYVEVYLDDLHYTARRPENFQPVFHEETIKYIPYPKGGREY